jgi:predicted signal transduction protein with EAL and GGDEF domain
VTETYLVTDPVVANRNLDVIRKFGVGIALDDFGTGYASIGFLRNFRFEKLKLDRTMVVEAGLDSGSLAMFTSSIAVARAMDMEGHRRRCRDPGPGRSRPHRRLRSHPGVVLLQGDDGGRDPPAPRRKPRAH